MRNLVYISVLLLSIGTLSSCSKKCIQCTATDKNGINKNTSNKVCENDFNRDHFEERYKIQFQDYNPVCTEVK